METFRVILDKGPKGMTIFEFETELGATKRAEALANLHRCKWDRNGSDLWVHAADWYNR